MSLTIRRPASRAIVPASHSGIYRQLISEQRLFRYRVRVEQSDLLISALGDFSRQARAALLEARAMIVEYAGAHPGFIEALEPMPVDPLAPPVVADMLEASTAAGVGPMAAVAGAVAQYVGETLLAFSPEVIVENGGDIYMKNPTPKRVCILAETAETPCLNIEVDASAGLGICTSSGRLGPSLSLGLADAVTVLVPRAAMADALATALGNHAREATDIPAAITMAQQGGATGVAIVLGGYVGAWGALRFVD